MSAYYSARALEGYKVQYAEYVNKYIAEPPKEGLFRTPCMIPYRPCRIGIQGQELLDSTEPLVIISEHLVPALDEVGRNLKRKNVPSPAAMAAEAAKAAFEK